MCIKCRQGERTDPAGKTPGGVEIVKVTGTCKFSVDTSVPSFIAGKKILLQGPEHQSSVLPV
jgi:hypothetical protein